MQFENKFVLGSAQFGMKYGIANLSGLPNQAEIDSLIDLANLNDIKKIDTAWNYGDSEKKIGKYLKRKQKIKILSLRPKLN